jgi:hypothetical protein
VFVCVSVCACLYFVFVCICACLCVYVRTQMITEVTETLFFFLEIATKCTTIRTSERPAGNENFYLCNFELEE